MKKYSNLFLIIGILVLINLISYKFFFRIDLTSDNQFTLSNTTKNILKNLKDPVTVNAYFSKNLPSRVAKAKEDFKFLLEEYAGISGGMIEYKFMDPSVDKETEQKAIQDGIQPVLIKVREKDEIKQQKSFLGASIFFEDRKEVIPVMQPGSPMEYELSTAIKKVSLKNKPKVAILQGHGEPTLENLSQVNQSLSVLYNVSTIDLKSESAIDLSYKAVMLIAPKDSFFTNDIAKLDKYLASGGNLVLALDRVDGDFQQSKGFVINTNLEHWLSSKGINIEDKFVIDATCNKVSVQQNRGNFRMINQVNFPYLPIIRNFSDHVITKGIEEVALKFASPLSYTGDTSVIFTVLASSSDRSGTAPGDTYFDVMNKNWSASDFNRPNIPIAGIFEGKLSGDVNSKMVIFTDGDFAISDSRGGGNSENNISFLVNSIDWLADDTGLIELRTKGVVSRPIKQEFVNDDASSKRNMIKYLNFGIPILLVILIGIIRMQRRKSIRMRRMQETY